MFILLVQVGSRLIPCHKLVLACVIPYFRYWSVSVFDHLSKPFRFDTCKTVDSCCYYAI